ncbi:MAG: YHS domain-containing (seleno)protein, partial [Cyanobacteria bacterium J06648_11]
MNEQLTALRQSARLGAIALTSALLSLGAIGCASTPKQVSDVTDSAGEIVNAARDAVDKIYAINLDERGRALHGYDAVSYFTEGEAVPGAEAHSLEWDGVTWFFASADNRDAFEADPERYAPANGGYCTFGVVLAK